MKYIIELSYSTKLEYKDYDAFMAAQGVLINGGVLNYEVYIKPEKEEVEA